MGSGTFGAPYKLTAEAVVLVAMFLVAAASTVPAPIVVSPSQYWEGNDGTWSSFTLQVGTPAQDVRVLISTAGTQPWVVLPEGCGSDAPSTCADSRGKTFSVNASSTWIFNNYYNLELESNLGITDTGEFGYETVGIGWQGSGGPVVEHQVIAGIATPDFWLGFFGLTPRPTNFTDFTNPQPSFLQTLKNNSQIPSLSWSYTAGAPYRLDKVLGSLTLGGFDLFKTGPKNMSFIFAEDISRDLTVGLQGISASLQGTNHTLLPQGIYTFIDSTVPGIWLPLAACQQFEQLFGLTLDSTTGLYLVNDTLHQDLLNQNPNFTFTISNNIQGTPYLDIVLPYASFDLFVDYPIVQNRTRYFPISRAANETQYTLGRVFLQEAYLTVDYERSEFYLSQTTFTSNASQHIITIPPLNSTSSDTNPSHTHSTGKIAGITIACVLVITALLLSTWFFLKRFKKPTPAEDYSFTGKPELDGGEDTTKALPQLLGDTVQEYFSSDKPLTHEIAEGKMLVSPTPGPIYEMVGDRPERQELPVPVDESRQVLPSTEPEVPVPNISDNGS